MLFFSMSGVDMLIDLPNTVEVWLKNTNNIADAIT
jgi:hypothetical protein